MQSPGSSNRFQHYEAWRQFFLAVGCLKAGPRQRCNCPTRPRSAPTDRVSGADACLSLRPSCGFSFNSPNFCYWLPSQRCSRLFVRFWTPKPTARLSVEVTGLPPRPLSTVSMPPCRTSGVRSASPPCYPAQRSSSPLSACELADFGADVRVQVGHPPLVNPIGWDAVARQLERLLDWDALQASFGAYHRRSVGGFAADALEHPVAGPGRVGHQMNSRRIIRSPRRRGRSPRSIAFIKWIVRKRNVGRCLPSPADANGSRQIRGSR